MKVSALGLVGALGIMLALPVAAQTTQSNSAKHPEALSTLKYATPPVKTPPTSPLVDLNTASVDQLDQLPGIGATRAKAIIKHRPYNGKDDLVNRHVIPSNIYSGIKDKVIAKKK